MWYRILHSFLPISFQNKGEELNNSERNVLAFVVPDPDEWYRNAAEVLGEERAKKALKAKVERHRPAYEAALASGKMKTRAQRDAEKEAEFAVQAEKVMEEALIQQKMRKIAIRELQAEGKLTTNG